MAGVQHVDVERAVAFALRDAGELDGLGDRIYTATPANVGAAAFLLVRRVGGAPFVGRPFVLDDATLQVDSYGGSKADAQRWARVVQTVLLELEGQLVGDGALEAHVSSVALGPLRNLPDEAFEPARPRYVLDVDVGVRNGRPVAPGASRRTSAAVTAGAGSSSTD